MTAVPYIFILDKVPSVSAFKVFQNSRNLNHVRAMIDYIISACLHLGDIDTGWYRKIYPTQVPEFFASIYARDYPFNQDPQIRYWTATPAKLTIILNYALYVSRELKVLDIEKHIVQYVHNTPLNIYLDLQESRFIQPDLPYFGPMAYYHPRNPIASHNTHYMGILKDLYMNLSEEE
jgi:hypothetical protein